MPKLKLPKVIKTEAQEYAKLASTSKDASNAANRQKTKLRNAVKDHWTKEALPIGSFIRVEGLEVRYEATESEIIDPERVLELYETEQIDRDQFLRMLNISKTEAKNVLGGDQVAEFSVKQTGKTMDIRLSELPVENIDDEFVMENSKVKSRVKRRKVFGGKKLERAPSGKPKRRIKTRTK